MHLGDFINGETVHVVAAMFDMGGESETVPTDEGFFVRRESTQLIGDRSIPSGDIATDFDSVTGIVRIDVDTTEASFFIPGGNFIVYGGGFGNDPRFRRVLATFTIRKDREEGAWFDKVVGLPTTTEILLERLAFYVSTGDPQPVQDQFANQFLVVRTGTYAGVARVIESVDADDFGRITVTDPFPGLITGAEVMVVSEY